jgi:hypothetical protein
VDIPVVKFYRNLAIMLSGRIKFRSKVRLVRKADNLTAIYEPIV